MERAIFQGASDGAALGMAARSSAGSPPAVVDRLRSCSPAVVVSVVASVVAVVSPSKGKSVTYGPGEGAAEGASFGTTLPEAGFPRGSSCAWEEAGAVAAAENDGMDGGRRHGKVPFKERVKLRFVGGHGGGAPLGGG